MVEPSPDIADFIERLSSAPGVYQMLDEQQQLLYVGKAKNLKKRVSSYFVKKQDNPRIRSLVQQIHRIEVMMTSSETEALLLESNLIKSRQPKYNVLLRDDKSYPYIHLSEHPFPRMDLFRSKKKPSKGEYYGPFPSAHAVKDTLNLIQKLFKIRNCRDSYFNARSRPCLQYQIKRCTAPCVDYVSQEAYQQQLRDARHFLQGKSRKILHDLEQRMETAVAKLAFEEAAGLRDQIKHLRLIQEQQGVTQLRGDADSIAIATQAGFACVQVLSIRGGEVLTSQHFFPQVPRSPFLDETENEREQAVLNAFISRYYFDEPSRIPRELILAQPLADKAAFAAILTQLRGSSCRIISQARGIKRRWRDMSLQHLQCSVSEYHAAKENLQSRFQSLEALLALPRPIQRMECFDISHTSGEATVASCVVFDRQGPVKKEYRQFNIEGIVGGDDYAAMAQALRRRLRRLQVENKTPDLLIIDGGKGQVAIALEVLSALSLDGIYLLGIAKGADRKAGWEQLILPAEKQNIRLDPHSPALHLLQHIRDEAHRFAISRHRRKRQKGSHHSLLEQIEGVGARRRQALLRRFGGLRALQEATAEELSKVPGISSALAQRIYEHFHRH
ncbi:MAG: excinuclease ABC subunit UvrC [Legionellaceae bacterium]|nr:excinuclease ABC subunit UvrC [Legionellaceae bacterium]